MKTYNIQKNSYSHLALIIVLLFFALQTSAKSKAQPSTDQLLKTSDKAYTQKRYAVASDYYESYLEKIKGANNDAVIRKLLDCYLQTHSYPKAIQTYNKISNKSNLTFFNQNLKIKISDLLARYGRYSEAVELLKTVDGYDEKADGFSTKNILAMKKDSAKWKIKGLNLNTEYREYSPFLLNNTLLFSSNRPENIKKNAYEWDGKNYSRLWQTNELAFDSVDAENLRQNSIRQFNYAKNTSGVYALSDNDVLKGDKSLLKKRAKINPKQFPSAEPLNGLKKLKYNAGPISINNNNHAYFSANSPIKSKDGIYKMSIWEGNYNGNTIENIKTLDLGLGAGTNYSIMHPTVNQDGTLLVFCSDKKNGNGGYDLYFAQREDVTKPWGSVQSFPSEVNTAGNEVYPAITKDGFLYFSSDGKSGLGGLDLYRINIKEMMNKKARIEHLEYPVNTSSDDFGWTQDAKGEKCFFTSDRINNTDNIFMAVKNPVKTVAKNNPKPVAQKPAPSQPVEKSKKTNRYVSGLVKDKITNKPLEGADIFLWDKNKNTVTVAKTNSKGIYSIPVNSDGDYVVKALKPELGSDCTEFTVENKNPNDSITQVEQILRIGNKYRAGYTWKLDNIHYDYNKWDIRPDARPILNQLVDTLKRYPITIELGSHTDSRGNDQYNMKLSELRAKSAVDYLISKGISASRLTAKGYGESKLVNKCGNGVPCSEADHQLNRRTEVKVLNYIIPNALKNINFNYTTGKTLKLSDLPKDFFENCSSSIDELDNIDTNKMFESAKPAENEVKKETATSNNYTQTAKINYFVVVSSSADKKMSESNLQKTKLLGYKAVLISENGRYRVAVPASSQTEADQIKSKLQKSFKDAWILRK